MKPFNWPHFYDFMILRGSKYASEPNYIIILLRSLLNDVGPHGMLNDRHCSISPSSCVSRCKVVNM